MGGKDYLLSIGRVMGHNLSMKTGIYGVLFALIGIYCSCLDFTDSSYIVSFTLSGAVLNQTFSLLKCRNPVEHEKRTDVGLPAEQRKRSP